MFINLRKMNSTSGSCLVCLEKECEVIRQLKDEMRKKGKKKSWRKIIICRVGEIAGFILLTITGKRDMGWKLKFGGSNLIFKFLLLKF